MRFDPTLYGTDVAGILALDQDGNRLLPLVGGKCSQGAVRLRLERETAALLFPLAPAPEVAKAGLWLYFSGLDECHEIVQHLDSREASYWHAILHRQEPDAANAGYWFRRVGRHPIFRELLMEADEILERYPAAGFQTGGQWDPLAFVDFCEVARGRPEELQEQAALEIQRVEWQLLFDYCARPR